MREEDGRANLSSAGAAVAARRRIDTTELGAYREVLPKMREGRARREFKQGGIGLPDQLRRPIFRDENPRGKANHSPFRKGTRATTSTTKAQSLIFGFVSI